jgi:phage shock protein C
MTKKLERDEQNKLAGGVMAGFANYFKTDVTIWRLGIVLLAILTAVVPVAVFYLIAWFVMPEKSDVEYRVVD